MSMADPAAGASLIEQGQANLATYQQLAAQLARAMR